jgi:hypothetical protein
MATKYSKYIITRCATPEKQNAWSPTYKPGDRTKILRFDEEALSGAELFAEAAWFFPSMVKSELAARSTKPHVHDYDEVLGLIGTDPKDPYDLCGESEVFLGGERYIIDRSALIYIPAGLEHGPFRQLKMDKPIIHIECRSSGTH